MEADEFAASLLMPEEFFVKEVRRFRQGVCTLAEICRMADERFHNVDNKHGTAVLPV